MYHQPIGKKELIQRIFLYSLMTLSVGIIVSSIVFFIMGYRFDVNAGRIEQYSMIQFNSIPSGAIISVDGVATKLQTPNKTTLPAGRHVVSMTKPGYKSWTKEINTKAGSLHWLSYAILVPNELKTEVISNYESINESLASPDNKKIIFSTKPNLPIFEVADITSDTAQIESLTILPEIYSDPNNIEINRSFQIVNWDDNGRYVLIKHNFAEKSEWLVMDTQDATLTKNITKLFDFSIDSIKFLGTGGNTFYILSDRDIRKINLTAGTISRPLIAGVDSFHVFESNIISYIGDGDSSLLAQKVVGMYRDGDDNPFIIKTIDTLEISKDAKVASSKYFGQYYLAIACEGFVEVYSGSYPSSSSDLKSMKLFGKFGYDSKVKNISFGPSGQFMIAQFDDKNISYDIEHQSVKTAYLDDGNVNLNWLNDKYLWQDSNNQLKIFEFDGLNQNIISQVISGQTVSLTNNNRYIYSFNKTDLGYQLQRTQMIISN